MSGMEIFYIVAFVVLVGVIIAKAASGAETQNYDDEGELDSFGGRLPRRINPSTGLTMHGGIDIGGNTLGSDRFNS